MFKELNFIRHEIRKWKQNGKINTKMPTTEKF